MKVNIKIKELAKLLNIEATDIDEIKNQLKILYKEFPIKFEEEKVNITIDDINSIDENIYNNLVSLCDNGKFDKALEKSKKLLRTHPNSSELNRVLSQIYFEKKEMIDAENYSIEALKLNPRSVYGLLLMGNIQFQKNETQSALIYWNTALRHNPDDFISLSNIGGLLAKESNYEQAKVFFEEALRINPKFNNALHGLSLIYYYTDKHEEAFRNIIEALKNSKPDSEVYQNAENIAFAIAKELVKSNIAKIENEITELKISLEEKSGKQIIIELSDNIDTPAKLEVAEYHNRSEHKLIYKKKDFTVPHLMIHELYHLKLIIDARNSDKNILFTSNENNKNNFFKRYQNYKVGLIKKGIDKNQVDGLINSLFNGLNSQIFNAPIDLFIEDLIYKNHKTIRPVQFISLYNLISEGVKATTDKNIISMMPKDIISKSKILNLVNAMHFKDISGIDLVQKFKSNKSERIQAEKLYDEFLEYRKDKEPGEEYEIIKHWGEDMDVDDMFHLKPENANTSTLDEVIDGINKDPYGLNESEENYKIEKRKQFIDSHSGDDLNTAVVMYMISALEFFENKNKESIKTIAFEFGTLGIAGINPKKDNYEVPSVKKKMTGYETLAYYYVSWAIGIPEMLSELGMPFENEYELAKSTFKI